MKELIGRVTLTSLNIPRKITFNKIDLFDETKVAHEFNFFFTNKGKAWLVKFQMFLPPFEYFCKYIRYCYKNQSTFNKWIERCFLFFEKWSKSCRQWELTFLSTVAFRATKILSTGGVDVPIDWRFQSYQNSVNTGCGHSCWL